MIVADWVNLSPLSGLRRVGLVSPRSHSRESHLSPLDVSIQRIVECPHLVHRLVVSRRREDSPHLLWGVLRRDPMLEDDPMVAVSWDVMRGTPATDVIGNALGERGALGSHVLAYACAQVLAGQADWFLGRPRGLALFSSRDKILRVFAIEVRSWRVARRQAVPGGSAHASLVALERFG